MDLEFYVRVRTCEKRVTGKHAQPLIIVSVCMCIIYYIYVYVCICV